MQCCGKEIGDKELMAILNGKTIHECFTCHKRFRGLKIEV